MITDNRKYFDSSLKTAKAIYDKGLYEDCALYLRQLATFALYNITGYYVNWKFERLLLNLGQKIPPISPIKKESHTHHRLSILHIATELYDIGGHTKLLINWVKIDKDNLHTVILTRMTENKLSTKVKEEINTNCNPIITLEGTILERAFQLKQIAQKYDLIILHIHPNDIIPTIAFSDPLFKTPILFLNHADHIFWIGISIIDCLIQIRESNIILDKERRGANFQMFLPIPVDNTQKKEKSLNFVKEKGQVILLSTGSEYKYKPFGEHNFFEAAYKIVNTFEKVIFFIAGVSPTCEFYQKYKHPRIICLGNVTNLKDYEEFCDIYVEGFPMASFTAMLQVSKRQKYIQLMYNPADGMKLFSDKQAYNLDYPKSFEEWFIQLSEVIESPKIRDEKMHKQYQYINRLYNLEKWKELLGDIYKINKNRKHTVRNSVNFDKFYSSINELINATLLESSSKINHFNYCYNLNFFEKVKVVLRSRYKTKHVKVSKKQAMKFLFERNEPFI